MHPDIISPYGKKSKNSSILLALGLILVLALGILQAAEFASAGHDSVSVIGKSVGVSENLAGFPVMMIVALAVLFTLAWVAVLVVNF